MKDKDLPASDHHGDHVRVGEGMEELLLLTIRSMEPRTRSTEKSCGCSLERKAASSQLSIFSFAFEVQPASALPFLPEMEYHTVTATPQFFCTERRTFLGRMWKDILSNSAFG